MKLESITEGCIDFWCWPMTTVFNMNNRVLRTVLVLPALFFMMGLVTLAGPVFLLSIILSPLEAAWKGMD